MRDVDMDSRLFTRKKEEPELTVADYRRRHADKRLTSKLNCRP
jgi:hypothetical protein